MLTNHKRHGNCNRYNRFCAFGCLSCFLVYMSRILKRKQIIYFLKFGFSLLEFGSLINWAMQDEKMREKSNGNQPSKWTRYPAFEWLFLDIRLTCATHMNSLWAGTNAKLHCFFQFLVFFFLSQLNWTCAVYRVDFFVVHFIHLFQRFTFDFDFDNHGDK